MTPQSQRLALTVMLCAYYLGVCVVGVASVAVHTSHLIALAFSLPLAVFGGLGVVSVVVDARRSETVVLVAVSMLTMLQGVTVVGSDPAAGLRIMIAPLALIPLAVYRRQVVLMRVDVADELRRVRR